MCIKHTMAEASDSMPVYYNSLYTHGVDGKRRVQVPAKWRPESPDVEFTLIVWPKSPHGPCLRALPPEQMSKLMARQQHEMKQAHEKTIGALSRQVAQLHDQQQSRDS